jgi:hypothetical protein
MTMLTGAILVVAYALLNRARGNGLFEMTASTLASRAVALSLMAGTSAYACSCTDSESVAIYAIVISGMIFWCVWGWGKYCSAYHGRDNSKEQEIWWIDRLGYLFWPPSISTATNRVRGTFCMALRGMYLYPMFIAFSAMQGSTWPLLVGMGCLLQGPVYGLMRYVPERYAAMSAEMLWGACIAVLQLLVLMH